MKFVYRVNLLILFLCATLLYADQPAPETRPWYQYLEKGQQIEFELPEIGRTRFMNDIDVYYMKDELPRVTLTLILEGGSLEEPAGKTGLTGLWGETLVYSGSDRNPHDKLKAELDLHGSSFSFNAGSRQASFTISSLSPYFSKDLRTVLEVISNPRFAEEDFRLILSRTLRALHEKRKKPAANAYTAASEIYFGENDPRGRITESSTLKSVKRADLISWQQKMISTDRMSIALTGDFNLNEVKQIFESSFSEIPAGSEASLASILKDEPAGNAGRVFQVESDIPQTTVLMRAPGISHGDPRYYTLKILDFLLGGDSFNSYLTKEVRTRRGWAYSVYSHYRADRYTGDITLFAQTANKNVNELVQLFIEILAEPDRYISEEAVENAKRSIINKSVFLYETGPQYLSVYLSLRNDGLGTEFLENYHDNLRQVSVEDVRKLAAELYSPERFFLMLVGPAGVYSPSQGAFSSEINRIELPE